MIVDSSALLAIIRDEPMAATCLQTMLNSQENRISAASDLEAAIVADRFPLPPIRRRSMSSSSSSTSSLNR